LARRASRDRLAASLFFRRRSQYALSLSPLFDGVIAPASQCDDIPGDGEIERGGDALRRIFEEDRDVDDDDSI